MKLGQKIFLSFFVVIILIIIVLQLVVSKQRNLVKEYVINEAKHFQLDWQLFQDRELRSLDIALELIVQDETLKALYLEKNREKVYEYTQPLFDNMRNQYNVDDFQFILPDGKCFLRMQERNFYGDENFLFSSLKNKKNQDTISGITLTDNSLGIRVLKPYYQNKTLIGYIEIGQRLEPVHNGMQDIAHTLMVVAVRKDLISKNKTQSIDALDYAKAAGKFQNHGMIINTLPTEYYPLLLNDFEEIIEVASRGLKVSNKIFEARDEQFALCVFEQKDISGKSIGAILGFFNVTPYLRALSKIKFFALIMLVLLCVIVSIIALIITRSILSPIEKLRYATDQVGKGNLDIVFQDNMKDEIAFLGEAFNEMVFDLKSTTTSIAALNKEIEERKKTERALRIEKDRAKRYFDISGVMFVALNDKGEIILVNKKSCEVLEATEQELIGKNWFDSFLPGKDALRIFEQVILGATQGSEYFENYINTAKGNQRCISWQNSILKDDNGGIIGTFSSGQDITERVQAEQGLKASEENYKKLAKELEKGQEATLNILEDLQDAKRTLEVSRQNFLNIIEKSTDSVLIVDDNNIVKFANNSATILFGCPASRIIDSPLGLKIEDEIRETKIMQADGRYRIAEMRAVKTEWEEKIMTLVLLHDMTERKNAENSLRIAAQEWRVTFDSISYGLSLLDLDGRIVRCNKALTDFVNKNYEDIIGQNGHELIHGSGAYSECPIYHTLNTKRRSARVIQKGDKWLSLSVDPLLNEENALIGLVHSVTDLTEQKMIEQKLREYTDYVENIIETAQAIIIGLDKNLNIQSINSFAENLLGKNRADIIAKNWLDLLIPSEYREEIIQVLSNCLEGSRVKGYEIPVLTKDNKEAMISWDSAELRDVDGKVTGIVIMGYDVSQRKEIEKVQRLAQLGTLVSHMAHEVNNPLMVISGRAQLALMEEIQNEEVKSNLDIVMKECQRAKNIIQRLLRFSRPSKGELRQTDVNASLAELVDLVEHQFGLNNVIIKKEYASNLPPVMVDEKQIHEVFMNLLTNAQDSISGEGTITIKTELAGNFIKITFTDSGEGISKEVLDKIFDPFFTTKKKGTGLGLSICYSIIKAHNGNLSFESVQGKGTTAVIVLPYMRENIDV